MVEYYWVRKKDQFPGESVGILAKSDTEAAIKFAEDSYPLEHIWVIVTCPGNYMRLILVEYFDRMLYTGWAADLRSCDHCGGSGRIVGEYAPCHICGGSGTEY